MSEQQQTPQVEQVASDADNVQPEVAVAEASAASDKVVDSTEKSTDEEQSAQEPEPVRQQETNEAAETSDNETEKKVESEKEVETKALDEGTKVEDPAVNGTATEEKPTEDEKEAVVNGDVVAEQTEAANAVSDETNGVHKRKAENGAEPVAEDEKSPKKAKVVDEAEQAKVEETAA